MKKILVILISGVFFFLIACNDKKETETSDNTTTTPASTPVDAIIIMPTVAGNVDTVKKSLKAMAESAIGKTNLKINYHSPAVKGRVIWGGLVPFDHVWVTGAHRATSIETNTDVVISGKKLTAGKYALFSIPGKEEWTIIINKKWDQHLADEYDINDDLVRLVIKPEMMTKVQERLMYQVKADNNNNGAIEIFWEKIKLVVPLQVL